MSEVKIAQSCPTLCDPVDYTVHGILQARILEWVSLSLFQEIFSTQGLSPTLQEDSLPAEPPGKPKNTGVGSLSLVQGILPTQESNRGLLHYRRVLYQLSYQEGKIPRIVNIILKEKNEGRGLTLDSMVWTKEQKNRSMV